MGDGKTVVRAGYGLFYDHPLLAIAFDAATADGGRSVQLITAGGNRFRVRPDSRRGHLRRFGLADQSQRLIHLPGRTELAAEHGIFAKPAAFRSLRAQTPFSRIRII